jgi:hypothetical protein
MKFNDLLIDIIAEEFANKKILQLLLKKWFGETPSDQEKEKTEFYLTEFFKIKQRLSENSPEVRTFLNRFPNFKLDNIKNVVNYNLEQIIFILSEFIDLEPNKQSIGIPDIFIGKDLLPTAQRISASKNLWYGKTDNLIVNEEGFRVYEIRNRKESQMWGYYNGYLVDSEPYSSQGEYSQWCTTRYRNDTNLYGSYRSAPRKRTFYFAIDESKSPDIEPNIRKSRYYISAIQTAEDSSTGFKITDILNDGIDTDITIDKLYEIYPKLRGHIEKIKPIEYTQEELGVTTDVLEKVDEDENNQYAFWKIGTSLKKRYIDSNKPITNPKSWDTMNDGLKKSYFDLTDRYNYLERFSSFSFINHIKKNNSDKRSLTVRLKKLGLSLGDLTDNLMKGNFKVARVSIDNKNIRLYQKNGIEKYGLFNSNEGDWVTFLGITYTPDYQIIDTDIYLDSEGETYVVETFSKTLQPTHDSFYSVYMVGDGNPNFDSHFLSSKKWKELVKELTPEDGNETESDSPKDYSDLKEREF